jgi:hypothetical protein
MNPLKRFAVAPVTLAVISLIACTSSDSRNSQPQAETATTIPYPPGEYVATARTPAAIDETRLALAIKAMTRKDHRSIDILRDEGTVFTLPKGTRIALQSAHVDGAQLQTSVVDTVDGIDICVGTVESGDRIGTDVALGCESLSPASR